MSWLENVCSGMSIQKSISIGNLENQRNALSVTQELRVGEPTVCSETCVGRIRYLGVLLYDADKIEAVASTKNEKDLYQEQLDMFLDPNDPEVIKAARAEGIPESWLEAAKGLSL